MRCAAGERSAPLRPRERGAVAASRYTRRMKPRILVVALLSLGLAACGNKGPLVLPTAPPPEQAPPAESPPATPPTPETLNDQQSATPPEGDASDAGNTTPPPSSPPPTP